MRCPPFVLGIVDCTPMSSWRGQATFLTQQVYRTASLSMSQPSSWEISWRAHVFAPLLVNLLHLPAAPFKRDPRIDGISLEDSSASSRAALVHLAASATFKGSSHPQMKDHSLKMASGSTPASDVMPPMEELNCVCEAWHPPT